MGFLLPRTSITRSRHSQDKSLIESRSFHYGWFAVFVHGPSHMCPLKKRPTDVLTV